MNINRLSSSFRDPSGFVFEENGVYFRQINKSYYANLEHLHESGLYDHLVNKGDLIAHETVSRNEEHTIVKPSQLEFVNYPYEWCFRQLQQAAITTLEIQLAAIRHGMTLKDASAFNLQFHQGKMIFIDTLSFDIREKDSPWIAYRQFCQHFLAPLLLMKYVASDANKLLSSYLDGIPLSFVANCLPIKSRFSPTILANIILHAKSEANQSRKVNAEKVSSIKLADASLNRILLNLKSFISNMTPDLTGTQWHGYYDFKNYNETSFSVKEKQILKWVDQHRFSSVWDLGGNDGHFTRLIAEKVDFAICSDIDPNAIDACYFALQKTKHKNIMPMVIDFTNPSADCGAQGMERQAFFRRIKNENIECILALALIHHLSLTHNQCFEMIAKQLGKLSKFLIIEFVDRQDSWVKQMLKNKMNAYPLYDYYAMKNFETAFSQYFNLLQVEKIDASHRSLYLMQSKNY